MYAIVVSEFHQLLTPQMNQWIFSNYGIAHDLLWPARKEWYNLGIALEVDPNTLEASGSPTKITVMTASMLCLRAAQRQTAVSLGLVCVNALGDQQWLVMMWQRRLKRCFYETNNSKR